MTIKVMFVCMGNICRSPTAHGVFRQLVEDEGYADKHYFDRHLALPGLPDHEL